VPHQLTRRTITLGIASAVSLAAVRNTSAQLLGDAPVRVIVPYAPGSANDFALRLIGQKVTELGGPAIVLEYKAGAGGVVGALAVKQAQPDGQTLFLCDLGTFGVNLTLVPNLPYDPFTDFRAITPLWVFPSVMAVPVTLEANTVPEFVALAKRTPGGLSYGSQGVGSGGHIRGELLAKASGAPLVHVPYRGGGPAVIDLVAGRISFLMGAYGSVQSQVEAKKLKVIGTSARSRLPILPDIPTLGEVGYPEVDIESWFGIAAPAGTPDAVIKTLHEHFTRAATSPDVEAKLNAQGIYSLTSSPAEFDKLIRSDADRLKPVIGGMSQPK
jgi:tripartite-type tricarboxylate transporter receptor subunit TctC